ncbi:uncharacterized protein LOC106639518 [Copidosoma floridanum]|uniref:uncharacterized protein LOC106639518 n=1 Tax=Copidosoma floridanum TaxID=29053 RepID=UPI0006C9ADA5|nr:uncharacterized protein LOC106639518 [Copidosoma floridanum]
MSYESSQKARYEAFINEASKAFLAKEYSTALQSYNQALTMATEMQYSAKIKCVLQYMVASCLVEANDLDSLAEAVMILQTIDVVAKKKFPGLFLVLAQAHCKLYRFKEAFNAISEGESIIKGMCTSLLEGLYIPGTNILINQDIESELWKKTKAKCSSYEPDAICFLSECRNITKPYVTANESIYLRDPAFNGMVIVKCNAKRSCTLKFHQYCWKFQKDKLLPYKTIRDEEFINYKCFTKNCMNGKKPSTLVYVEIVAANGTSKIYMESAVTKKPCVTTEKASERDFDKTQLGSKFEQRRRLELEKSMNYEPEHFEKYDSIVILNDECGGKLNFSSDDPDTAKHKEFLVSMFVDYIRNNLVRVCDLYAKFNECKEFTKVPDLDILNFLLTTGKIKMLDQTALIPPSVSQDEEVFGEMKDVYDNLMDDLDDCDLKNVNKLQDSKLSEYSHKTYASENLGGDAPPSQKISDKKTDVFPREPVEKAAPKSDDSKTKLMEIIELKTYIHQMEMDKIKLIDQKENLEKELVAQNTNLELLKSQLADNSLKWATIQEKIDSFKQSKEIIRKENVSLKKEIIDLMQVKKELEKKLLESENSELRRKEMLANFQKDIEMIEDKINADWVVKSENMMRNALEKEVETRVALLNDCLNNKYSNYTQTIQERIDFCNNILDVIGKINGWMAQTLDWKQFLDSSEWLLKLSCYSKALIDLKDEYEALANKLNSEDSKEKYEMREISLNYPDIPQLLHETAGEYALKALNALHDRHRMVLHNIQQASNQVKPVAFPSQPTYPTNYPQIGAPPPGLIRPPTTAGFNTFSHVNQPMVIPFNQYNQIQDIQKQMQIQLQKQVQQQVQQQLQNWQQEFQEMKEEMKKLEMENKVSVTYPESIASDVSLTTEAQNSSLQITLIESESTEHATKPTDDVHCFIEHNGSKIPYATESMLGDTDRSDIEEAVEEETKHKFSQIWGREAKNLHDSEKKGAISFLKPFDLQQQQKQSQSFKKPSSNFNQYQQQLTPPVKSGNNLYSAENKQKQHITSLTQINNMCWLKPQKVPFQQSSNDLLPLENQQKLLSLKKSSDDLNYKGHRQMQQPMPSQEPINEFSHKSNQQKRSLIPSDNLDDWEDQLEILNGRKRVEVYNSNQNEDENIHQNQQHSNSSVKSVVTISAKDEKEFEENLVMKYLLQDSEDQPRQKRPNLDSLVKRLRAKYPGTVESDIIFIISEVRKRHNNTLQGLTVGQIVDEAEEFFANNQHIHLILYFPNDTSETLAKLPGLQRVHRDSGSSTSYSNVNKGPSIVRPSLNSPKKTWNTLPTEEIKWAGSLDLECSICTNQVKRSNCYTLDCRHSFHYHCAKSWFKTQRTCPNCRAPVTEPDEFPPLPA